jgi:hypothetical protein
MTREEIDKMDCVEVEETIAFLNAYYNPPKE